MLQFDRIIFDLNIMDVRQALQYAAWQAGETVHPLEMAPA
jgi:hypothetical protein